MRLFLLKSGSIS